MTNICSPVSSAATTNTQVQENLVREYLKLKKRLKQMKQSKSKENTLQKEKPQKDTSVEPRKKHDRSREMKSGSRDKLK